MGNIAARETVVTAMTEEVGNLIFKFHSVGQRDPKLLKFQTKIFSRFAVIITVVVIIKMQNDIGCFA